MKKAGASSKRQDVVSVAFVLIGAATLAAFLWPKQNQSIPVGSPLNPNLGVADPDIVSDAELREQENHPVTKEMVATADRQARLTAPSFALPDGTGQSVSLTGLTAGGKPLLIFFIERNCPCCLGAKHFVDRLADNFEGKASVVGIINATGKQAETWRKLTQPHFKILEDPQQVAIRAYAAERGVYTTLVNPQGEIVKAYPGYSLQTLQDISNQLAILSGIPDPGFHSNAAPTELTSGCLFPPVKPDQTTNQKEQN